MSSSTPVTGKRKRGNEDTNYPDEETTETTSELGLKLVGQLKRSTDKNGREIAHAFLDLPDKDDYPDYYEQIAMPLSLNGIEERLEARKYKTLTQLEGDLKRLVQNAKDYNDSKTNPKSLSNFFPKHNPDYQLPDYRAVPTPIPTHLLDRMRESSVSTNGTGKLKLKMKASRSSMAPSAEPDVPDAGEDTQDAMIALLEDLSVQEGAINFEKRPPKRDYPDYYRIIDRPTSISDVTAMVNQGKVADWNALAREVRLIWKNAKEYNEPDSDIYAITEDLEQWFEEQVQAAGADSPKAPQRLSLSQPKKTGLKLKLGASNSTSIAGGSVDSESLRRQRDETAQALGRARGTPAPAPSTAPSMTRSLSSVEPNGDTIVVNGAGPATPGLVNSSLRGSIPPPKSATPATNGMTNGQPQINGIHPSRSVFTISDNPMERKFRDQGKGLDTALLTSVTYTTHPHLPADPKWSLTLPADPLRTQISSFIYLPPTHYYFRLTPQLSPELKSRSSWKVCVSSNWNTVAESPHASGCYDFRLQPGENTIVVDAIASLREGERKEYAPAQMQFDFERVTLVVVLVDRLDS
ncbi:Protein polybromo-1 [Cyphellophora attinorum]|uniref:Protein polybromo-1 n=1 Tax=Cyphellophora attinorum TaxID=1664694 RepID=A0A0N1GZ64_9EURO|nr:Protein polybromo-1 [Phialophora attinorum]KPI36226.1 Protein polybromo-1 [Phialophora attinorum]